MEEINKRWSLEVIKGKVERLKKVLGEDVVLLALNSALFNTDTEIDQYYSAYYDLRDKYSRLNRSSFGTPKQIKEGGLNPYDFLFKKGSNTVSSTESAITTVTISPHTWTDTIYTTIPYTWSTSIDATTSAGYWNRN